VTVDDIDMGVTHVIRGDDHISNTPKHVLLFRALGAELPAFSHVPLILGADKKRLSKRHGATSVMEYERQGYVAPALVNFLALLGWSPGNDRELMSMAELAEAFSLDGISGSNAVFNTEKLDWMNGQYLSRLTVDELMALVRERFAESGLASQPLVREGHLARLLELLRPRAKRLSDFVEQGHPIIVDEVDYASEAVEKHLSNPELTRHIAVLREALTAAEPFDEPTTEATLRAVAAAQGIKAGALIHAVRVGLTGRTTSPGLFELLALLGRARTLARLDRLQSFLEHRPRT
jgi:glutamyl-tRNA synthetase